MTVLEIISVVVALTLVVATACDHRARRHCWRTKTPADAGPLAVPHPFLHHGQRLGGR